jgi:error-prone DNA polymerase
MGFYPPDALVHEAQHRGVDVLPVDVNASAVECRVETSGAVAGPEGAPPVRLGLACVNGLSREDASAAMSGRESGGVYRDVADLAARSGVSPAGLRRLAWAGACDSLLGADPSLSSGRRPALWQAGAVPVATRSGGSTQLAIASSGSSGSGSGDETPALPAQSRWEEVQSAYETTGISLGDHPIGVLRERLPADWSDSRRIVRAKQGRQVTCAGLVVARQRPATANGMVFVLLEDEHDIFNVVLTPPVAEDHSLTLRLSRLLEVTGRVERRGGTTSILAGSISPLRVEQPDAGTNPPHPVGEVTSIAFDRIKPLRSRKART